MDTVLAVGALTAACSSQAPLRGRQQFWRTARRPRADAGVAVDAAGADAAAAGSSSSGEDNVPLASRTWKFATAAEGARPTPQARSSQPQQAQHGGALGGEGMGLGRPGSAAIGMRCSGWAGSAGGVSGSGSSSGSGSEDEDQGLEDTDASAGEGDEEESPEDTDEEEEGMVEEAECLELPAAGARGRGGGRRRGGSRGSSATRGAAFAARTGAGARCGRSRGGSRGRSRGSRSSPPAPAEEQAQLLHPTDVSRRGALPLGQLRLGAVDYLIGNTTLMRFFPGAVAAAVEERAAAARAGRPAATAPGASVQLHFGAAAGTFTMWIVTYGRGKSWVRLGGGKQLRRVLGLRDGAVIELEAQDLPPPRRLSNGGGGNGGGVGNASRQQGAARARVISYGHGATAGQLLMAAPLIPTARPQPQQQPSPPELLPPRPAYQQEQQQDQRLPGPGDPLRTLKRRRLWYDALEPSVGADGRSGSRLSAGGAAAPCDATHPPASSSQPQPDTASATKHILGSALGSGDGVALSDDAAAAAAINASSAPAHGAGAHGQHSRHDGDRTSGGGSARGEGAGHSRRLHSLLVHLPPPASAATADSAAPRQPGELRLCGLTFHPQLVPFVYSEMRRWEDALTCPLSSADPAKQQLEPVASSAAAAGWEAAFTRHGLRRNILHSRLATLLGLSGEGGGPDAPLPEGGCNGAASGGGASPQPLLHTSLRVAPAADGGRASSGSSSRLEVVSRVKKSGCLGLVGGYVAPRALADEVVAAAEEATSLRSSFAAAAAASALLRECRPETCRLVESIAAEEQSAGGGVAGGGAGAAASAAALSRLLQSLLLPLPESWWQQPAAAGASGSSAGAEEAVLLVDSPWAALLLAGPEDTPATAAGGVPDAAAGQGPEPNCMVLPVRVRGLVVLALVAVRDVEAGAPLVLDRQAAWWGQQTQRAGQAGLGQAQQQPPQQQPQPQEQRGGGRTDVERGPLHRAENGTAAGGLRPPVHELALPLPPLPPQNLVQTAPPQLRQPGAARAAPLVPLWRTYDSGFMSQCTEQGAGEDQSCGDIHGDEPHPQQPQPLLGRWLQDLLRHETGATVGSGPAAATATATEKLRARPWLRAQTPEPPAPSVVSAGGTRQPRPTAVLARPPAAPSQARHLPPPQRSGGEGYKHHHQDDHDDKHPQQQRQQQRQQQQQQQGSSRGHRPTSPPRRYTPTGGACGRYGPCDDDPSQRGARYRHLDGGLATPLADGLSHERHGDCWRRGRSRSPGGSGRDWGDDWRWRRHEAGAVGGTAGAAAEGINSTGRHSHWADAAAPCGQAGGSGASAGTHQHSGGRHRCCGRRSNGPSRSPGRSPGRGRCSGRGRRSRSHERRCHSRSRSRSRGRDGSAQQRDRHVRDYGDGRHVPGLQQPHRGSAAADWTGWDARSGYGPSGHKPGGHEPRSHEPRSYEPSGHKPSGHEPRSHEPSSHEPSGHKPSSHEPSGHEPRSYEPSGHKPSSHEPSGHKPSGHKPSGHEPRSHEPRSYEPSGHKPSSHEPSGHEPRSTAWQPRTDGTSRTGRASGGSGGGWQAAGAAAGRPSSSRDETRTRERPEPQTPLRPQAAAPQADGATGSRGAAMPQLPGEGAEAHGLPVAAQHWPHDPAAAGNAARGRVHMGTDAADLTARRCCAATAMLASTDDTPQQEVPRQQCTLRVCAVSPDGAATTPGVAVPQACNGHGEDEAAVGSTPAGPPDAAAAGWTRVLPRTPVAAAAATGGPELTTKPPPLRLVLRPGQVAKTPVSRMKQQQQQPTVAIVGGPPSAVVAVPPPIASPVEGPVDEVASAPTASANVAAATITHAELPRPLVQQLRKHAVRVGLFEPHRGSLRGLLDGLGRELGLGSAVKAPMLTRLDHLGLAALVAAQQLAERRALRHVHNAVLRVSCCPLPGLKLRLWHTSYLASGAAAPTWLDVRVTAHFGELLDNVAAADQASRRALSSWLYGFTTYAPAVQLEPEPSCAAADAAVCAALGHGARVAVPLTDGAGPLFARDNWHTRPVPLPGNVATQTTGAAAVAVAAAAVAEAAAAAGAAERSCASNSIVTGHQHNYLGSQQQPLQYAAVHSWPHTGWPHGLPPPPYATGCGSQQHAPTAHQQPGMYGHGHHLHHHSAYCPPAGYYQVGASASHLYPVVQTSPTQPERMVTGQEQEQRAGPGAEGLQQAQQECGAAILGQEAAALPHKEQKQELP